MKINGENAKLKQRQTRSMMDVSTLRGMLGRNFQRQLRENRRNPGHDRETLFQAQCLPPGGH